MADDRTDPQYKLRMSEELHAQLKAAAEANKRSMNAEIVARLEASMSASAKNENIRNDITKNWLEAMESVISAMNKNHDAMLSRAEERIRNLTEELSKKT